MAILLLAILGWIIGIFAWFYNLLQALYIIKTYTITTMTILMWIKIIGIPLGYGVILGLLELVGII